MEGLRRIFGRLLAHDAAPGVLLLVAAAMALLLDNSRLSWIYDLLLQTIGSVQLGPLVIAKPLLLWINDGLMALFFCFVALEIKRELIEGELSSIKRASLPAIAALGGMVVPAAVYVLVNLAYGGSELKGWAIPSATDIAFSVGVLALLGSRVPTALKVFLLALAVIDDLGAIVIIAAFYTSHLSPLSLWLAGAALAGLLLLNVRDVRHFAPYVVLGALLWVFVLKSGVHATLAGVALGFALPHRNAEPGTESMLVRAEHGLQPWVAFGIAPLFAFANAGVPLGGLTLGSLVSAVPLGITAGLVIGKPIGILGACLLAVRWRLSELPAGVTWRQIAGVGLLGGIGFTMSLFIGTLAFPGDGHALDVRLGVLVGSAISAVAGYLVLRLAR